MIEMFDATTKTTTETKENIESNAFTMIVKTKRKSVVTPPESPKIKLSKICVECSVNFLSKSKDYVRCERCHRELVNAMNHWSTYLTTQAYHPLRVVRVSPSNMKIRMKKCHMDWQWKYLWILSRLVALIDKSRGKTTTQIPCSSIQAMKNGLRELRCNLLDGMFDSESAICRDIRSVWKMHLKSDKVAFDKTAREAYICAFGLNAYFESMRGHSMRGFSYPSKLSERGKRWYNASCRSNVYDITMNEENEMEIDLETADELQQTTSQASKYALSRANIPKMMSQLSGFLEPYGDFVYVAY